MSDNGRDSGMDDAGRSSDPTEAYPRYGEPSSGDSRSVGASGRPQYGERRADAQHAGQGGAEQYGGGYGAQPEHGAPAYGQQPYDHQQYANQYGQQPYDAQYGGPGGYPAGGWQGHDPYAPRPSAALAITALVFGILAVLGSIFVIGGLFGLVAVILGIIALVKVGKGRAGGKGMAIAGIVTGVLGMLVAGVMIAAFGAVLTESGIKDCFEQSNGDQAQLQQCLNERSEQTSDRTIDRTNDEKAV